MPTPGWRNSTRRTRLPADWARRRRACFERDGHQCTEVLPDKTRCPAKATDCDHIIPGDDHSLENLRSLCSAHHRIKSSHEGGAAYAAKKKAINNKFRRTETHPGLL